MIEISDKGLSLDSIIIIIIIITYLFVNTFLCSSYSAGHYRGRLKREVPKLVFLLVKVFERASIAQLLA